ncbi:related to FK506-binding protein 2 precursor [Rhynchosporium agropyri]|uniref:peptidylprolyl isomerase n=3 Tax=Rhynchosporium TaxID=38037 RepID=A0A1E1LWE5_RHYSE|nr:related to FK506-binding protein 2 precursor [Rhynchosporium commune]CZS96153.1 related to FK506-binding protein 2 precursor [Rhynchosporium agropyri]CZT41192.1 related to FK506-binding protein 2 precursor [Rhynchosporium secalis]
MKNVLSFLALVAVGSAVAHEELKIEIIRAGECSSKTKHGDFISVNYNGTLTDGTLFDSTYSKAGTTTPFAFEIGGGKVIRGFELGHLDMCIGDRRKLTIPPSYGYGNRVVGPIPANSTLIFYTELVAIGGGAAPSKK